MSDVIQSTPRSLDIELRLHDVQAISSANAVAAFFAQLGYNTDARIVQTPGNLGITAEGTARPIKKIELIADQENLFQVYLLELVSVTVAHTRALARVFRNRAGNYLLVLTLLLPIKQKLAATDWLIDQLVYRLYSLTEEEIAVVEGRE